MGSPPCYSEHETLAALVEVVIAVLAVAMHGVAAAAFVVVAAVAVVESAVKARFVAEHDSAGPEVKPATGLRS